MIFLSDINNIYSKSRILIAPLDWGLGHATRCIPIIRHLLQKNKTVLVAAEGPIATLIKMEFPDITILPLRGYRISYSSTSKRFFGKMITQLPKINLAISRENKWLSNVIRSHQIDAVISDNRFGLWNDKIHSVFITHQLGIKTGNKWIDYIVQKINYRFINRFKECWVPDFADSNNVGGELSHPVRLPKIPVTYIGLLSRLEKGIFEKKYKYLFLLSGPEPQRTIFENIIIEQLSQVKENVILVRGLPDDIRPLQNIPDQVQFFNHLPATQLSQYIQESEMVVVRSGYSSIMDLIALEQKAILVPTPGQTEQEYLAMYLSEKNKFKTINQKELVLKNLSVL